MRVHFSTIISDDERVNSSGFVMILEIIVSVIISSNFQNVTTSPSIQL